MSIQLVVFSCLVVQKLILILCFSQVIASLEADPASPHSIESVQRILGTEKLIHANYISVTPGLWNRNELLGFRFRVWIRNRIRTIFNHKKVIKSCFLKCYT